VTLPPDDWPRLKEVFACARSLAADERPAYLTGACRGNEALRQEVESLLASDERARGFLEQPAVAAIAGASANTLAGRRIGAYQLASRIGVGGMGEVYSARDTRLNRQVAIKVLLPAVANDPDRLARFSREAQVLASLNHPHIAQIHGIEDADGVRALVMELVEGLTLADRIAQAPIPVGETLAMAKQIAEALEAAHELGIVHRDLKPANIKVREDGTVKVLDFGLAKAVGATSGLNMATMSSPPLGAHATDAGAVLGTAAYMSPEQARGKAVDRRADIWAFGCVLYEMLTRRRAFDGDSSTDVPAASAKNEPDWSMLPAETPAPIRTLMRRCLEKDRARRLDSATAVRLEIDDALSAPPPEAAERAVVPSRRLALVAMATMAGVAIAAITAWIGVRPEPRAATPLSRFAIVTPAAQPPNVSSNDRDLALSPDGRYLVYRVGGTGTNGSPLMVRAIDQLDARPLADTTNAYTPFFSPDSRWIGFFENEELKKVPIAGGPVMTLGAVMGGSLGASWADDNTIVFATDHPGSGLWRVSADGGEPSELTKPDAAQRESDHAFPSVLPGGRGVLFTITAVGRPDNAQVAVLDLRTGRRKTLVRGGSQAELIESPVGSRQGAHLTYAAAGTLRAVRFDPIQLEVLGDPVTVVQDVLTKPSGGANYAVSRPGTLVYMPGTAAETPIRSLVWVDRKGHEEPISAPLRAYGPPRLSPDGTRVAMSIVDQGNSEVWIWDFAQETLRRLTFSPGVDSMPLWTPDGRRIVFMSARDGRPALYSQAIDGGTVDRLTTGANPQWPTSITRDGMLLFGFENGPKIAREVIVVHLTQPTSPGGGPSGAGPPVQGLFRGNFAEISPDGRYLAYQSDESGRMEVHVRPFPQVHSDRWQISTGGATRPAWARSGRELFYLDESGALTVVPVRTSGPTFVAGRPATVFDTAYVEPNPSRHYDVSPDGQRFLMVKDGATRDPNATPASMVVVEHWFEELNVRVR